MVCQGQFTSCHMKWLDTVETDLCSVWLCKLMSSIIVSYWLQDNHSYGKTGIIRINSVLHDILPETSSHVQCIHIPGLSRTLNFNFWYSPGPNSFSKTFQILEILGKIQDFPAAWQPCMQVRKHCSSVSDITDSSYWIRLDRHVSI